MFRKYHWHIVGWSILFCYSYIELFIEQGWNFKLVMLVLSFLITNFITFYLFYFIIWKPLFSPKKNYNFLLLIPVGLTFFIGFRFLLEEIIYESLFGFDNYYNVSMLFYIRDNIWRAIFIGLASIAVVLFEYKYQNEKRILKLRHEKLEAERSLLRSQINPHFLFNTLSFLHVKTLKYDEELGDTIRKLSEMLRYSLESSKEISISILKEIEMLENYIDIFRKRFEGAFYVNFEVSGKEHPGNIEPMILIPFVENSIKHGIVNNPEFPIQISISVTQNSLSFQCENQISNNKKDDTSGIGLENIKQRLNLSYKDNHALKIYNNNNIFKVSLSLELE